MNLPNKLTFLRIFLVPLLMFFYLATFIPYGKVIAVVIFIGAAITDHFDGKLARKHGLVTDLGKLLDPLADKMLYTCAFFLIIADGTVASPWGVIALSILGIITGKVKAATTPIMPRVIRTSARVNATLRGEW